jgi:23S rRNA G2069 N7-methylase RlmK/C1962 C5-methylase RlmI
MIPRRYQLRKDAVSIVERGHPWLFREQMSSAASVFADGQWLRLVDGQNRVVGHGIYEAEGAIAIRILRTGDAHPDAAWLRATLRAALARRAELARTTDAIRLVHGESDGIPAVVVDRFADTLVVASYSAGSDALARYVARALVAEAADTAGPLVAETGATTSALVAATAGAHTAETGDATGGNVDEASDAAGALVDKNTGALVAETAGAMTNAHLGIAQIVGPAKHVLLRPARRRRGPPQPARVLRGAPPDIVRFTEDGLPFAVDLAGGHKTGTYLDLRGLRRMLAGAASTATPRAASTPSTRAASTASPATSAALRRLDLAGARVLNLFAYTGMLARAAEAAGAADITNVDQSERALELAAAHHVGDASKHHFVTADVFEWLPALDPNEQYDLVIVDPPSMTSRKAQVPGVLAAYRKLYRAAIGHVKPGGLLVAACCTSRVERDVFGKTVREALGKGWKLERDIPPEVDHRAGFAQADYLKILVWRAAG